jgi:hypothetical protein
MTTDQGLLTYINLRLAALDQPTSRATVDPYFLEITGPLLRNHYQKNQLLRDRLCPVDERIQSYLDSYLRGRAPRLPSITFVLDRSGLGRVLSLPASCDSFASEYVRSYRVPQGVLHNSKSDRRTTKGSFHIVEGGLPVPNDKLEVPLETYQLLLDAALKPPESLLTLPFTADQPDQARTWVSLLLRPIVCPATNRDAQKSMEIRFFAPASLVSNLDFVESIFGNGGDPFLPENDSALDVAHWTGHTGCVILAPHLVLFKKAELGLPYFEDATERQKRDGMCWRDESELYNDGNSFKIACRDRRGVMVTVIADNYFGYCKKEVKTQISFAANLYGACEEEHAGGAIAFPTYVLGNEFYGGRTVRLADTRFNDAMALLGDRVERRPEGYAVDRSYPDIFYVPEDSAFNVRTGLVQWSDSNGTHQLTLRSSDTYVLPSGYKIRLEKQLSGTAWRLVGVGMHGTLCHKPCTVSGGGKSEISKSISDVLLHGPVFIKDYRRDMDAVAEILARDFSGAYRNIEDEGRAKRTVLSSERSLGSVIKLLTPSTDYTDEYNLWVRNLPQTIRQLVFTVKRYYRPEWGEEWRRHFTVDRVNGFLGHELKYDDQLLIANYLRVGYDPDGSWRIYKLRPDFHPADKVQVEDDITASVVLPREQLNDLDVKYQNQSVKLLLNCERRLFQRPDDAIHPGVDKQAEADIAGPDNFLSNFEPLSVEQSRKIVDHVVEFDKFSEPMKCLLKDFVENPKTGYVVCSARPRLVDGAPSKNPRYLQLRPDLVNPRDSYLAEIGTRLDRQVPSDRPVHMPVNAVLSGRRNNPPDPKAGIPPLAVYNPIHYQELPELFMEFISSLTGKSPSTTGFGSEGALTKGPFNAIWPVVDLNNAFLSMILTGYAGFTTSAGHIGPKYRVDHDISMLVPEIWCRIRVFERDPEFLIKNGYLEKINDFDYNGRRVLASRLGYRITAIFADRFLGRIFETPDQIFPEDFLRPEKQDLECFASGVDAIVASQRAVAEHYFEDGSVDGACPPLKALLHVMAKGSFEGMAIGHPDLRRMFTRESVLQSEWYLDRLRIKRERDVALWMRHLAALAESRSGPGPSGIDLDLSLALAKAQIERVSSSPEYLSELVGTIGADPLCGQ